MIVKKTKKSKSNNTHTNTRKKERSSWEASWRDTRRCLDCVFLTAFKVVRFPRRVCSWREREKEGKKEGGGLTKYYEEQCKPATLKFGGCIIKLMNVNDTPRTSVFFLFGIFFKFISYAAVKQAFIPT